MELYLVRHGETDQNQKGVYYGWTDCPLNTKGIRQAKDLGKSLSILPLDMIITSPLSRTRQTAEEIAGQHRLSIQTDARLKEIYFGEWEGRHFQEIQRSDPKAWEAWTEDWQNVPPPNGESFQQFYQRVRKLPHELLDRRKDQTVLLVGHQGSLRVIVSELLGLGETGYWHFHFDHGVYSHLEIRDGHCTIRKINGI